jgi:hypothetical protein
MPPAPQPCGAALTSRCLAATPAASFAGIAQSWFVADGRPFADGDVDVPQLS